MSGLKITIAFVIALVSACGVFYQLAQSRKSKTVAGRSHHGLMSMLWMLNISIVAWGM